MDKDFYNFFKNPKIYTCDKIPYSYLKSNKIVHQVKPRGIKHTIIYRGVFISFPSSLVVLKMFDVYGVKKLISEAPPKCFKSSVVNFPGIETRYDYELCNFYLKNEKTYGNSFTSLFDTSFKKFVAKRREKIITLFTAAVLHSDGYVTSEARIFKTTNRLPQELQSVLSNRVFYSNKNHVTSENVTLEAKRILAAKQI